MKNPFFTLRSLRSRLVEEIVHRRNRAEVAAIVLKQELRLAEGRISRLEDRSTQAETEISELKRLVYGRLDDGK